MAKPYGLASQKLCYIPVCKSRRKRHSMIGEYGTCWFLWTHSAVMSGLLSSITGKGGFTTSPFCQSMALTHVLHGRGASWLSGKVFDT